MKKFVAVLMALGLLAAATYANAACSAGFVTLAKAQFLSGLHDASDLYKIAFYQTSATLSSSTEQYTASGEITASGNYPAGGFELDYSAQNAYVTVNGTSAVMDFDDEVNSNITFAESSDCALIYNSTAVSSGYCTAAGYPSECCDGTDSGTCANAALAVYTFTAVQPSAGTLTVTMPAPTAGNAVIEIAFADEIERQIMTAMIGEKTLFAQARDSVLGPGPWDREFVSGWYEDVAQ